MTIAIYKSPHQVTLNDDSKAESDDATTKMRRDIVDSLRHPEKPSLERIDSTSENNSDNSEEEIVEVKETCEQQEKRIRHESIFGHLKTWKLLRIIVKAGDDLRQEQFAMQLISQIDQIFKRKKLNIWLKPYEILATGKDCGLIEFLTDSASIDAIKKKEN